MYTGQRCEVAKYEVTRSRPCCNTKLDSSSGLPVVSEKLCLSDSEFVVLVKGHLEVECGMIGIDGQHVLHGYKNTQLQYRYALQQAPLRRRLGLKLQREIGKRFHFSRTTDSDVRKFRY